MKTLSSASATLSQQRYNGNVQKTARVSHQKVPINCSRKCERCEKNTIKASFSDFWIFLVQIALFHLVSTSKKVTQGVVASPTRLGPEVGQGQASGPKGDLQILGFLTC